MKILEFTPMRERTKKGREKDSIDSYLSQSIRDIVYEKVQGLYSRADTMSGYELDGYECEDPEELISSIFDFIEQNFKWKRKPVL